MEKLKEKESKDNLEEEEIQSEEFAFEKAEDIQSALKRLPKLIKEKEETIFNNEQQKGDLIASTKTVEEDISRGVAKETITSSVEIKVDKRAMSKEERADYIPKFQNEEVPKYTNEMQRTAIINTKLLNHKDYNTLRARADKIDKWISIARIELSYMKRIFRVAEALARYDAE